VWESARFERRAGGRITEGEPVGFNRTKKNRSVVPEMGGKPKADCQGQTQGRSPKASEPTKGTGESTRRKK